MFEENEMTFTRGDDEYLLTLQITPGDDEGFTWEIVVTENRDGRITQFKELSPGSFDTTEEAEDDGKTQLLKMFQRHVPG